ncbi:putative bifunctional diguanylate cyclase/phosphodiesterase [Methylobacterium nonmethylotrophicum]|uniref:EAL domain-containing protein n=1 Tax=Methylobacterium nonmethylotrophicum TaxID=1141884 RepID=A0A4Z0NM28_9HYPH|nr:EAL domain-containing protein [Methylobacterium nonmethylotrophicum]TGD96602.1 EAL domain-containing protein [Methylobacterium nonmethylotrophicum]
MLQTAEALVSLHDGRLVGLSLLIGVLAAITAIDLLHHARATTGTSRGIWLSAAAVAGGFGLWASQVIAQVSVRPADDLLRHREFLLLSLVVMTLVVGGGLRAAVSAPRRIAPGLGGGLIGFGLAGVAAAVSVGLPGAGGPAWLAGLCLSFGSGMVLAGLALGLSLRESSASRTAGALLLSVAVILPHAVGLLTAGGGLVPVTLDGQFAASLGFASLTLLVLAFTGLTLDGRARRRREAQELMRNLADAAVEGIAVCEGGRIVTVNTSLAELIGRAPAALVGRPVTEILPQPVAQRLDSVPDGVVIEAELVGADGEALPVDVIRRPVGSRSCHAVAIRDLRARRQAEQHIQFLAHHDTLTGLPNRASFRARLDEAIGQARSTGRLVAVLCLDLDRFKDVNDLYGHAMGDGLLQALARWVSPVLGPRQMMARLGGDEFAILMPDLARREEAGDLAEEVLRVIREGNARAGSGPILATSIGIALCPTDAEDGQTLLNHADAALYCAKSHGRGVHRFFEPVLAAQIRDRRSLEHDLRHAVERGEFRVVYQPQMAVDTGIVVGFEALLRWEHPERGNVPPDLFIPISEETGSILGIGEWVLRETCREAASWEKPLRIAVNVSAVQLHAPGFSELVHEILFTTGLAPARLELEITETALIRDLPRALATLRRVKALGVRIAMDDFGTGYSSLSNLRAFPFDKIKIDRSFIRAVDVNRETAAIMRAVLGLGRGLGLPVLAEGVETRAELAFLDAENCHEAQGYLLGRPGPIALFAEHTREAPRGGTEAA